jgi:hypothetical protein
MVEMRLEEASNDISPDPIPLDQDFLPFRETPPAAGEPLC